MSALSPVSGCLEHAVSNPGGEAVVHAVAHELAALDYAALGWPVLPVFGVDAHGSCACGRQECAVAGKHPRTTRGLNDATVDKDQIDRWWSLWPGANVGIQTGARAGLVVLDIDQPEIPSELADLIGKGVGGIPTVRTGGGGLHLYFRHPGGEVPNRVRVLGLPVDVRADGGYVIAPPSRHTSGNEYIWITEGEPPELPETLREVLRGRVVTEVTACPDARLFYEGTRNQSLMRVAGALRRAELTPEAIKAALVIENEQRCQPPLELEEVERVCRSILTYPEGAGEALVPGEARKHLCAYTLAQVAQMAPEELDWMIDGYVAAGLITSLSSKPKIGKTTLVCAGISAMCRGEDFLGRKTRMPHVLYLTEENAITFSQVLARTGVTDHDAITIVPRAGAYGLRWDEVIEDVRGLLEPFGPSLLIVDTLPDWVSLPSDWENSSSMVKEVMRPLRQLASEGHAVLSLFHQRKSGGGIHDSTRGSSAFAGDADILVTLEEQRGVPNGRTLNAIGRPTATPRKLNTWFDGSVFQVAGDSSAPARDQARIDILAMLPNDEADAMLVVDIREKVSCSDNTVDRVLKELVGTGLVCSKKAMTASNRHSTAYWLSSLGLLPPDSSSP